MNVPVITILNLCWYDQYGVVVPITVTSKIAVMSPSPDREDALPLPRSLPFGSAMQSFSTH
uniref:GG11865 n=1 Tax=Drosophila erecta TaxID=7220 RepID=B3P536_DROER